MSVQDALLFIRSIRTDAELRDQLSDRAVDTFRVSRSIVELGASRGLSFTYEELEEAFRQDWAMRWFTRSESSSSIDGAGLPAR